MFYIYLLSSCEPCFRNSCKTILNFDGKTSEQILYMLTDPCRYDRWKRPSIDGEPTTVSIRIYIYFIGNVEAQHLVSVIILKFLIQVTVSITCISRIQRISKCCICSYFEYLNAP